MLDLRAINKSYHVGGRPLHVLRGIDLTVERGEMVSIMGSSGSGKSTLLNVIGLLDNYDTGEYRLDGTLVKALSEAKAAWYRSRYLGFVFQTFNLIPFKTAAENVALPLYYQRVGRRKRNRVARQYLERLGLLEWAEHRPTEMSGGQQQRVAIARAIVANPKVILADEPTGALDSATSRDVIGALQEVNAEGVTVVIVTHEHDVARMTQRTIHLKDGLIENGRAETPADA